MDDLQAMRAKEVLKATDGVVTKVLVVDGVVLQRLYETKKVVGLCNKDTRFVEEQQNAFDDVVNVFDVGEDIGCRDDLGPSVLATSLFCDVATEESDRRRDAPFIR